MYLIDTNVFLEILLNQEKKKACKDFLDSNVDNIHISDFSLHSIGVILFRNNKEDIFSKFANDVIPKVRIISLSEELYKDLSEIKKTLGLDFDDAYQYKICMENNLKMATMDLDFKKAEHKIEVMFL